MNQIWPDSFQFTDIGLILCASVFSSKNGAGFRRFVVQFGLAVIFNRPYRFIDLTLHQHAFAAVGLRHAIATQFILIIIQHGKRALLLLLNYGSLPFRVNHNLRQLLLYHLLLRLFFLPLASLLRVPEPWIRSIFGLILRRVVSSRLLMILRHLSHRLMFSVMLLVLDCWPPVHNILAAPRIDDLVYQAVIGECFWFAFRTPILALARLRLHRTGIHVLQWRMLIR